MSANDDPRDGGRLIGTKGVLGLASVGAGIALATRAVRSERLVLTIRSFDRRLERDHGMFGEGGAATWTVAPRLYAGLHRRVVRDVAERVTRADATIVDIGAGPGDLALSIGKRLPSASIVGVEPSSALAAIARGRGVHVVEARAEILPFDDGSVDMVVSTLSAHHWDDHAAAFTEIRRVLRPGSEGLLYDVRFAGLTSAEVRAAARAGLPSGSVERIVLDERVLGLRPYSLVTIQA